MTLKNWHARTKNDLIIEVWQSLDCEIVGAPELRKIQDALRERFGVGGVQSPAAIARILADEGAALRHPEVLNCDTEWRRQQLEETTLAYPLDFSTLEQAAHSLGDLESLRRKWKQANDEGNLRRLDETVRGFKHEAHAIARSTIHDPKQRAVAKEIVQWLTIWLTEPQIFADWLSLRRSSPEYVRLIESLEA